MLKLSLASVLAIALLGCSSSDDAIEVPLYAMPFKAADGKLQVFDGSKFDPLFIKGMNIGVGKPGTQPGELAPTEDDYDRWFQMMSDMGVNSIRIYTLHYPRFYKRLHFFNITHKDKPIYVFHGIWLDEDDPTKNLFDMQAAYDDNIKETIDCVHGNNYVFERLGRASGEFDTDISPWVIGWLVGREVFPDEVQTTNKVPTGKTSYLGAYVSLAKGSETAVWWAERIDKIATYEIDKYNVRRPISVSSWPTLDPIHHPTEGLGASEDQEELDLADLDISSYAPGYFASYHAYPYYPDWMNEDPNYQAEKDAWGPNSYLAYLKTLRAHYYPMPLVVAEVGVPSSWGNAHYAESGMSHGGQDEVKQGTDDLRVVHNAYDSETGGAILFAWIDEWWKRTWIVDELALPRERYKLWHNVTSPEQNFGLLDFVLDPPNFDMFPPVPGKGRIGEMRAAADAEFFHLKLTLATPLADGEEITIGYDTYADDRGESILPNGIHTTQRSEFALSLTTTSAELKVMDAYDQFGVWHDTQAAWHNKTVSHLPGDHPYKSITIDGGPWNLVRWKNNGEHGSDDGKYSFPATVQEIGKLRMRKASEQETGQSAVVWDGNTITVRLPWTLLQVTDPSDLRVLDDDPGTRDRETALSEGFRIAISLGGDLVESPRLKWDRWEVAPHYTEHRKLAYQIFADGLKEVPDR